MQTMQRNELTEGPILPALLKFCWPVLVALFLQSLYGAVDLMVVGRFGDAASVSGVGTGSAVMQLVTMILSGLTTGATVVIGRHIGEKLFEHVKNEAKRLGCYEVTLNVWAGNTSAEKFYEKMGLKTKERQLEYIL